MKILINTPPRKTGGVGNYYSGLKDKFSLNIKYHYVGNKGKNKILMAILLPFGLIKFMITLIKFKPEIIHLNPSLRIKAIIRDAIYLMISKFFKKKVVIFWRGWNSDVEKKISNKYPKLFKRIYNKANAHIVLASDFKNKLQKWGITKSIFLETTKVDDELLANYKKEDIKNKKMQILFLSRLEKYKGIYETIDIFKILQQEYPDIKLILAGSGSEVERIKDKIKRENIANIEILGHINGEDKINAFNESLFYILPSYAEGMPNSVLEAMAFGCIIISRPVGGLVDFFEENKMGHLIQSLNPEDYAQKIDKILYMQKKERIKISEYNYEFAKKKFYASTVAKRLEKIYENL